MPKTKFQEVIFGIIMVCVMVYGMICYNLALPVSNRLERDLICSTQSTPGSRATLPIIWNPVRTHLLL